MTSRGWRIDRVPAKPVRLAEDGRVSVPLWLLRDGVHHSDLDLRLSSAEAEVLRAQLSRVLDAGGASGGDGGAAPGPASARGPSAAAAGRTVRAAALHERPS